MVNKENADRGKRKRRTEIGAESHEGRYHLPKSMIISPKLTVYIFRYQLKMCGVIRVPPTSPLPCNRCQPLTRMSHFTFCAHSNFQHSAPSHNPPSLYCHILNLVYHIVFAYTAVANLFMIILNPCLTKERANKAMNSLVNHHSVCTFCSSIFLFCLVLSSLGLRLRMEKKADDVALRRT